MHDDIAFDVFDMPCGVNCVRAVKCLIQFRHELLADGRQRVVRHCSGPERVIRTGIGPVEVRRQKVRDRATEVSAGAKVGFTSNIPPKRARRAKSLDALLAVFYPRGISTGDVQEALSVFPGTDAPNLSPRTCRPA